MALTAAIVGAIVSAALSAGATAIASNSTRKSQNRALGAQNARLRESMARTRAFDDEKNKILQKNLEEFTPEKQEQRLDHNANENTGQITSLINENAANSVNDNPGVGGVISDVFKEAQVVAKENSLNKAIRDAGLFGRFLAHQDVGLDNSIINSQYANKIGEITGNQQRQFRTDQNSINAAGIPAGPNAGTQFLTGVGQSIAQDVPGIAGNFGNHPVQPTLSGKIKVNVPGPIKPTPIRSNLPKDF